MNDLSSPSVSGPPHRSNPFCTRFVRPGALAFRFQRPADAGDAADGIVTQLVDRRQGLIVGGHGSGKSTLIQTLLPKLHDRFCELRTIQTHAPTATGLCGRLAHRRKASAVVIGVANSLARGGLMVVDGIEQLGLASRCQLTHIARSKQQFVLATSHRDLWPFSTLFRTQVTADLIADLADLLVADAPAALRTAIQRELRTRPLTTLENVRELWFELYDVAESFPETLAEPSRADLN